MQANEARSLNRRKRQGGPAAAGRQQYRQKSLDTRLGSVPPMVSPPLPLPCIYLFTLFSLLDSRTEQQCRSRHQVTLECPISHNAVDQLGSGKVQLQYDPPFGFDTGCGAHSL